MAEEEVKVEETAELTEEEPAAEPSAPEPDVSRETSPPATGDPGEVARIAACLNCLPDCDEKANLQQDLSLIETFGGSDQGKALATLKHKIMATEFEFVSAAQKKAWLEGKNLN
jgi:hypothetical protein